MKKIISILCLIVIASALQAQEFQVGELYYRVTSNSTPYTVEVAKLSKKSRVTRTRTKSAAKVVKKKHIHKFSPQILKFCQEHVTGYRESKKSARPKSSTFYYAY